MRLSKKTFCYSIIIALILVVFIILYFAFMLPSLYVEHMAQENLDSIAAVQRGYIENRSYENLIVKNPTGSATLELPLSGNKLFFTGKAFRMEMEVQDEQLLEMLEQLRNSFLDFDNTGEAELPDLDWEGLKNKLFSENQLGTGDMFSIKLDASEEVEGVREGAVKMHMISNSLFVFEGGITDGDNDYTSYIAFSQTDNALIFSFLPVMTPQMTEIRPIVLQSLPMITAVVLLLVLVASQIFSKKIVNPIICLANYAEEVKMAGGMEIKPLPIRKTDEIGELGNTLNELYARLQQQYRELEQKNQTLSRENKRQEVFLRASSHQLKTPVTAALLLIEGMIGEIGKYKNTKAYLPEVKKQLHSMQNIVEDILYLNHCADHIQTETVDAEQLMEEILQNYRVQIEERGLHIQKSGNLHPVLTDHEIMKNILDNLLSNAVTYTPDNQQIDILMKGKQLDILNWGGGIEAGLLPNIYQPFVSSNTSQKGRGLGLYIASYYAEILGCDLKIQNVPEGVLASLTFPS